MTKLKADIAELAATQALLMRGYNVLQPIGDRLAYDIAVDIDGRLIRIQVKSAWYNEKKMMHIVDNRRTRTNRRFMRRKPYEDHDFDIAILYVKESDVFYVMPVTVFNSYASSIAIVESEKRQRPPRSFQYRERWDLIASSPGS